MLDGVLLSGGSWVKRQVRGFFFFSPFAFFSHASQSPLSRWAEYGYAIPHESLRRGLYAGNRTVFQLDPEKEWQTDAWFAWYRAEDEIIHGHHWAEENVVFPRMLEKMQGATIPDRMTADHTVLLKELDTIASYEPKIKAASSKGERAKLIKELQQRYNGMLLEMLPHLDAEVCLCIFITHWYSRICRQTNRRKCLSL